MYAIVDSDLFHISLLVSNVYLKVDEEVLSITYYLYHTHNIYQFHQKMYSIIEWHSIPIVNYNLDFQCWLQPGNNHHK